MPNLSNQWRFRGGAITGAITLSTFLISHVYSDWIKAAVFRWRILEKDDIGAEVRHQTWSDGPPVFLFMSQESRDLPWQPIVAACVQERQTQEHTILSDTTAQGWAGICMPTCTVCRISSHELEASGDDVASDQSHWRSLAGATWDEQRIVAPIVVDQFCNSAFRQAFRQALRCNSRIDYGPVHGLEHKRC